MRGLVASAFVLLLVVAGAAAGGAQDLAPRPWLVYKTRATLPRNYGCGDLPRRLDRLHTFPGRVLPSARSTADDPVWSPDGRRIAFSSGDPSCTNADGIVGDSAQLWEVDSNGRNLRALTRRNPVTGGPTDASPSWSPDGQRIAFARFDRKLGAGGIYVVSADGRDLRRLSSRKTLSLDWSPDGHTIAFVPGENLGDYFSAANQVALLDIRSRRVRSFHLADPYDLAWSPNGRTIAATTGNAAIAFLDPSRGIIRRMSIAKSRKVWLNGLTWSPDGRSLAYSAGSTIFTMRLNGNGVKQIVAGTAPDWRPSEGAPNTPR